MNDLTGVEGSVSKIKYLEGLRGLAALVVVNEHLMRHLFPLSVSEFFVRDPSVSWLAVATYPPFNLLHKGNWAVTVFFVLSGLVLSHYFFSNQHSNARQTLARAAVRYVRLAIPVFASFVLVWGLYNLKLTWLVEQIRVSDNMQYNPFNPVMGFVEMLRISLFDTFIFETVRYNPVYWTMQVEFLGSMGVFAAHLLFLSFRNEKYAFHLRLLIYAGVALLINAHVPPYYLAFLLGVLLSDLQNNVRASELLGKHSKTWKLPMFLAGVMLCAYSIRGMDGSIYSVFAVGGVYDTANVYKWNALGAAFLILSISYIDTIKRALSTNAMQILGDISFPLYLTHYAVIASVTAWLYLNLNIVNYHLKQGVIISISLTVMFVVAYVFNILVNKPTVRLTKKIRGKILP